MGLLATDIFNEMGPESLNDHGSQLYTSPLRGLGFCVYGIAGMDEREGRACEFKRSGVIARKALEALNE